MTKNQKIFFNIAQQMSFLSDFKGPKLGAVVVCGKRILSSGYNSQKTNPTQYRYNRYRDFSPKYPAKVHAEIAALNPLIRRHGIEWDKVEIYVYRELKNSKKAMARPCPSCMALIKDLGIRTIHYTTEEGYSTEIIEP